MSESTLARSVKSLNTTKNIKDYLPRFFNRGELRKQPGAIQAWIMHAISTEIPQAFDIIGDWPENYSTLCAARLIATKFCEEAEAEGYSNDICSYVRNGMGYLRRCRECGGIPPEAPVGGIGNPVMLLSSAIACEPRYKWFEAIATHYIDLPIYCDDISSPIWDENVNDPLIAEHYKAQIRASLKGLIAFLEKETGKKFNIDQFRQIMERSQEAHKYWAGTLDLRKALPCPMGAEDYFACVIADLFLLGLPEATNFFKSLYQEVEARVKNHVGVIANEKYRFSWLGLPPWYNLGLYNWLEEEGAVCCVESPYWAGHYVEVDLTDPIEGLVDRTWQIAVFKHEHSSEVVPDLVQANPASALTPTKLLLKWVKDYKLDGVVMHRTRSCRALSMGELHGRNILEKEGIPTLIFESDMSDPRAWSDAQIKAQFKEFLSIIDEKRKRSKS